MLLKYIIPLLSALQHSCTGQVLFFILIFLFYYFIDMGCLLYWLIHFSPNAIYYTKTVYCNKDAAAESWVVFFGRSESDQWPWMPLPIAFGTEVIKDNNNCIKTTMCYLFCWHAHRKALHIVLHINLALK